MKRNCATVICFACHRTVGLWRGHMRCVHTWRAHMQTRDRHVSRPQNWMCALKYWIGRYAIALRYIPSPKLVIKRWFIYWHLNAAQIRYPLHVIGCKHFIELGRKYHKSIFEYLVALPNKHLVFHLNSIRLYAHLLAQISINHSVLTTGKSINHNYKRLMCIFKFVNETGHIECNVMHGM